MSTATIATKTTTNNNTSSILSGSALDSAIVTFIANGKTQREQAHTILNSCVACIKNDWNCTPLTKFILGVNEIKTFDKVAIMKWVTAATGGYIRECMDDDGKITFEVDSASSVVTWNKECSCFKIKALPGNKDNREENQAKRIQGLNKASAMMMNNPFWLFQVEGIPSVYKFSTLVSALKRAVKEADNLTEEQNAVLTALIKTAQSAGVQV